MYQGNKTAMHFGKMSLIVCTSEIEQGLVVGKGLVFPQLDVIRNILHLGKNQYKKQRFCAKHSVQQEICFKDRVINLNVNLIKDHFR